MTRDLDDLLSVWHEDETDVCSADELLARMPRHVPIRRRRNTILAVAAAIIVIVGVVVAFVGLRPDATKPVALPPTTAHSSTTAPTSAPTPTASANTTPAPTPTPSGTTLAGPTRVLEFGGKADQGVARVRVPQRWFSATYRGAPFPVPIVIDFLSTNPFVGVCAGDGISTSKCDSPNLFPPGNPTPQNGLVLVWQHEFYGPLSLLTGEPGRPTVIAGQSARLYEGRPQAGTCPVGAASEIAAAVEIPAGKIGGNYAMTACLGPRVSNADRQAITAMLASMRFVR